jgi:hypothetical protein
MGEILGLGLSHYPGPLVPVQFWPRMLSRNVEVGRIAPELFADKERWPAPMRAEWGDDEGQAAAREHRSRLLAGYRQLRAELDAFRPDLVLIWGDDQYENFQRDCIPAFCIGIFDEVVSKPYGGGGFPFKTEENVWGLPPETELRIAGHREAALGACRALLEAGFDLAYSLAARHPKGLAHSFNNTILYLDYERAGFPYPVIPFHVNCYGNDLMKTAAKTAGESSNQLTPPSPSPKRCFELGAAVARYFAASPWRVALIGSSSWSHGSLTQKHGRLYPDVDADRTRLTELQSGTFTGWGEIPQRAIEDSGQHEILNWICLAGAMTQLGQPARIVDYVESYIFNSAKCFASFPPSGTPAATPSRAQTELVSS